VRSLFRAPAGHDETVVAIVVSGPQATGKTTLAMAIGMALSIPVFSRDPLMCLASGCRFVSVECTCSDTGVHRARFQQRRPAGRRGHGWDYVTAKMKRYQPDADADFEADAIRPVADLVAGIAALARDATSPGGTRPGHPGPA
jgi:hypothetical protein